VDHRRHGLSQAGPAFGGRDTPVLRDAGQARQLPGGGERVGGLAVVPAQGAGRRPGATRQGRRSRGTAFATKPQIALQQIEHLMGQGAPRHCVLANAGYGVDTAFRERLSELGLRYVVGVTGSVTVWPPGRGPCRRRPTQGAGAWPSDCAWAVPLCRNTLRNRSRNSPWRLGPSIGTPHLARRHERQAAFALGPRAGARSAPGPPAR